MQEDSERAGSYRRIQSECYPYWYSTFDMNRQTYVRISRQRMAGRCLIACKAKLFSRSVGLSARTVFHNLDS